MTLLSSRGARIVLALAVLAAGVLAWYATSATDGGTVKAVGEAHVAYPFDVKDERLLVGDADNVFVGRVVEKVGASGLDSVGVPEQWDVPTPRTQFSVEVLNNVKGALQGTVTVSQDGGYVEYAADRDYPEAGVQAGERVRELILVEGDPLLEPGQEYLLVTKQDQERGWHQITAANVADIKIKDETQRKALVNKFEKAKQEQKDPEAL